MCQSMSSSSGWGCGWWSDAMKENGAWEIGVQRTIFELGEDTSTTSMSTWAVWGLSKYSHISNTHMSSHQIIWIGYILLIDPRVWKPFGIIGERVSSSSSQFYYCFCNNVISVDFCHCIILQLSLIFTMFIFSTYKGYTDIWYILS